MQLGQGRNRRQRASRRVDLSRELRRVLIEPQDKRLLEAFLKGENDISDDLVFPSPQRSILDPDNLYHRYFQPVLARAGLRKIRLHDLTYVRLAADPERSLARVREGADGPQFNSGDGGHLPTPDSGRSRVFRGPAGRSSATGRGNKSASIRTNHKMPLAGNCRKFLI
jgi:hypothetical protein